MTDREYDREAWEIFHTYKSGSSGGMSRSAFYKQKTADRQAFYRKKEQERALARADARRGQIRSGAIRTLGRGGASVAHFFSGSFDTLFEVFLAILLLFGMFNASGGYAHIDEGIVTPVQGVIAIGGKASTEVGEAALNLGYEGVYDGMSGGIGWKEDEVEVDGLTVPVASGRYFTTDYFVDFLLSIDTGSGDNIFEKGFNVLYQNVVLKFLPIDHIPIVGGLLETLLKWLA